MTETIEENQAKLRSLLLGIDFVIPVHVHTLLDGTLDPLQQQIEKGRISDRGL